MHRVDVDDMLDSITFEQFQEWIEFDRVDPIGARRGDLQAASICASVMNAAAMMMRSRKRFRVQDYLLEYGETKAVPPEKQSVGLMKMIAQMWAGLPEEPPKQ